MKEKKPFRYWENHIDEIYEEAKKHATRVSFLKTAAGNAAQRMKIVQDVCKHLPKKGEINLTLDQIKQEAKKYGSITEFKKKSPKVFNFIKNNFLIEELCTHMDLSSRLKRVLPTMPKEKIQQIAKKYQRRCDFNMKEYRASRDAKKLGIYDEVCAHMNLKKKIYNPITKQKSYDKPKEEEILAIAKQYKTREEFKHKNRPVYEYCYKNKLFENACAHMPKDASCYHSFEDALAKAKKCKTKSEFHLRFEAEYKSAYRRGYLEKICSIVQFEKRDRQVSIGEKTSLSYINRLLGIELKPMKKISWLNYKGNLLTLDGYDEKNKIAFEYNGHLHLKPYIRKKDTFKRRTCKKLGIKLIVIKEYKDIYRRHFSEDLPKAVFKECKRLNITIKNPKAKVIIKTNSDKMNIKRIKKLISECHSLKEFSDKHIKEYKFLCYLNLHHLMKDLKKKKAKS